MVIQVMFCKTWYDFPIITIIGDRNYYTPVCWGLETEDILLF